MTTIDIASNATFSRPAWYYSAGAAAVGVLVGLGLGMTMLSRTPAVPVVATSLVARMAAPSAPDSVAPTAFALPVFGSAPQSGLQSAPVPALESEALEPCWANRTEVRC